MIYENLEELRTRIEAVAHRRIGGEIPIVEDTTNYMRITSGSVLRIDGDDYFITGEATEGRFGIADQPKFWVKYAWDLESATRKILKLVFYEEFTAALGLVSVRCRRSPEKESRVLDLVEGDRRFMQGRTARDPRGNNVRIIDHIRGPSLYTYLPSLEQDHEEYFHETFPQVFERVVGSVEALLVVHEAGMQHGDVRSDHILVESGTGEHRWIDFDFEVNYSDFDVWSIGNILTFAVGGGICSLQDAARLRADGSTELGEDDALVFFRHRLANFRKVFPYVPEELNEVLMRFSRSTTVFYEELDHVAGDLRALVDGGVLPR